ncbi:MAG: hypothetical protein SGBAC_008489 [Bacillariaceae sp.]
MVDDATQSTLQESEMSIMDPVDNDRSEMWYGSLQESRMHKVTARTLPLNDESMFNCPYSIDTGDVSVLSNLSMLDTPLDKALDKEQVDHLDSDMTIADEFAELLVSLGVEEPENIVYCSALIMCVSRYFSILDMLVAAVIVGYIQSEKSPSLDRFLRRLYQELYDTFQAKVRDAVQNSIPHSIWRYLSTPIASAAKLVPSSLEERLAELEAENKELQSHLESEKWQVRSLQHSLSRKETILESEVVNRATLEQSSATLQAIHDHEKTQLEETVKRLQKENESQKKAMELMEGQAAKRDHLLANILQNCERSEASLSRKSRRRSERGAASREHFANHDSLHRITTEVE